MLVEGICRIFPLGPQEASRRDFKQPPPDETQACNVRDGGARGGESRFPLGASSPQFSPVPGTRELEHVGRRTECDQVLWRFKPAF